MQTVQSANLYERLRTSKRYVKMSPQIPKATILWLSVLTAVLALLFMETSGPAHRGYNIFINTDSDDIGAEVWVDGNKVDVVGTASHSGVSGGAWWGHLSRGKHTIELKKKGYESLTREVDMQGKPEYLGVDLKPLKD